MAKRRELAITPKARERQMIALAVKLAEKKLADGTASSQLITHYLKLASPKERLEQDRLREEIDLIKAKRKSLENTDTLNDLYAEAIKAMRVYTGEDDDNECDAERNS